MQDTVKVSLSREQKSALDDLMRQEGIAADELINQAIEEYLFFKRFRSLRERLVTKARARGIYTDQDIFDRVSRRQPMMN